MEKQSPFLRLWELGESEHSGLIRAMISAAAGVLSGMLPYYAAAQIIIALLGGNQEWTFYLSWCAAGLIGYALRACLYAPGPSAAQDDRQLVWPGGNAVYDAGYDRLWGKVCGVGQDLSGDERRHCGIHRRH